MSTITIWGIAKIGKRRGQWVKCYIFDSEQRNLALNLAKQRIELWPLHVTDDETAEVIRYFGTSNQTETLQSWAN